MMDSNQIDFSGPEMAKMILAKHVSLIVTYL